jgi:hypothetical protein
MSADVPVPVPEFEVSVPLPETRAFAKPGHVLTVEEEEAAMERTVELGGAKGSGT